MSRFLKIICLALFFTPMPFTVKKTLDGKLVLGADYALADKGRGRGGNDDDDDDDRSGSGSDRDDDRSGRRDGRDDDRDDDDDDRDDDRDRDRDDEDSGRSNGTAGGGLERSPSGVIANLHLRYSNGWDERILNGRYILVDPEGRTVTRRAATAKDLERMRAAVTQ